MVLMNHSNFAPPLGRPGLREGCITCLKKCGKFLDRYYRGIACVPLPTGAGLAQGGATKSYET